MGDRPFENVMDALGQAIEITSDCRNTEELHSDQGWAYDESILSASS